MPCSSAREASVSANSGRASSALICCTQVSTDRRSVLSTRSNSTGSPQVTPNWSCMRVALAWSLRRISASARSASSVSSSVISHCTRFANGRMMRTQGTCGTGRSRQVAPQPRSTTLPRAAASSTSSAV